MLYTGLSFNMPRSKPLLHKTTAAVVILVANLGLTLSLSQAKYLLFTLHMCFQCDIWSCKVTHCICMNRKEI